jgi:dipeptidyl aminopeptidase/acylaminoacyl peptidase
LLIGQGSNDPRVVQAESDQMVQAMRARQRPIDYLVFPDEGHGFLRPENRTRWFGAVETFLADHLGGRAEPPGTGESWDALRR